MASKIFNLSQHHSIANQFVGELRNVDIQGDSMRFRRNLERIGEVLAYEMSKGLRYVTEVVATPLGEAEVSVPVGMPILATILRAGLPLHQGVLNYFDRSDNAFISAYRRHHKDGTFEINLEYVSCPNLDDVVLVVCDAMLATGASVDVAIQELLKFGQPREIHVIAAIAAADGIEHIERTHPSAKLWLGAIDEELTAKSYIVPGLGDAGDLAYGQKVQD